MLVPDMRVSNPGLSVIPRAAERAASMFTPGAQRSGLTRPSRVGPALLKCAIGRSALCGSYAPTAIVRKPLQIVAVVEALTASRFAKSDWQEGHAASRSIQE